MTRELFQYQARAEPVGFEALYDPEELGWLPSFPGQTYTFAPLVPEDHTVYVTTPITYEDGGEAADPLVDRDPRGLLAAPRVGDPRSMDNWMRKIVATYNRPLARVYVSIGAGTVKRVTGFVQDRTATLWKGRWLVQVYITEERGGDPNSAQTVEWITGYVVQTISADQVYLILTDVEGQFEFNLSVSTTGVNRDVYCHVLGRAESYRASF